ncbi:mitochondrial basic amino acids transporter-like [Coccinella septempunctata]|uniref:mitochondrial basic amino acids transporter-like n=1 Tax=Coccinella septempunctata TaxID=41139 RepID=UPI001D0605D7|nr:mitochondrial basic amino acids transporter-like [Coccinella septempunctata]XP_044754060.1 mitochondrial basic amino acids transporter-like [Coccinella septempunctata]
MSLEFIAGCVGGCAGLVVGHPLDTLKVHLQNDNAKNPKYRGSLHLVRTLVVKEGLKGIYKGISSPLLGVAAINAIVFGVQGGTRKKFKDQDSLFSHFVAGGAAGFLQSFVCSPMELAKTRLQVSEPNLSLTKCIKGIYEADGIRGLYRGLNMTIAREVPSFAAYFVTYEYLTRSHKTNVSTAMMIFAGGTAGMAAWIVTYPVDVIKTRIQLDGFNSTPKYLNALDCLKKSVSSEGYGVLTRGLSPTLIRAFPTNAAIFTVVTWTMRFFDSITLPQGVKKSQYFVDNMMLNSMQKPEII